MEKKGGKKPRKSGGRKVLVFAGAFLAMLLLAAIVWMGGSRSREGGSVIPSEGQMTGASAGNEINSSQEENAFVGEESIPEEMLMSDGTRAGVMVQETVSIEEAEQFLEEMEGKTAKVEQQDLPKPSPEAFRENEIQGYAKQIEEPEQLTREDIEVISIGSYTGIYVEDGSNEEVMDIASVLVRNNSDEMLQAATLTYRVNDSETAEFVISNLPAGTAALVQEKNKRAFQASDVYVLEEDAYGMAENARLWQDRFKVTGNDGMVSLENLTEQSFQKVYVYYKYIQQGGAYLGGVTFRTAFEEIGPGETVKADAGHFSEGASEILMVEIAE